MLAIASVSQSRALTHRPLEVDGEHDGLHAVAALEAGAHGGRQRLAEGALVTMIDALLVVLQAHAETRGALRRARAVAQSRPAVAASARRVSGVGVGEALQPELEDALTVRRSLQ